MFIVTVWWCRQPAVGDTYRCQHHRQLLTRQNGQPVNYSASLKSADK